MGHSLKFSVQFIQPFLLSILIHSLIKIQWQGKSNGTKVSKKIHPVFNLSLKNQEQWNSNIFLMFDVIPSNPAIMKSIFSVSFTSFHMYYCFTRRPTKPAFDISSIFTILPTPNPTILLIFFTMFLLPPLFLELFGVSSTVALTHDLLSALFLYFPLQT